MLLFIPKSGADVRVVADEDHARYWMKRTGYTGRVVELSVAREITIPKPAPVSAAGQAPAPAPLISAADFKALLAQNQALIAELQRERAAKALAPAPGEPEKK